MFDESVAAQDRIEQIIQEIHAEEAARSAGGAGRRLTLPADSPADDETAVSTAWPHARRCGAAATTWSGWTGR